MSFLPDLSFHNYSWNGQWNNRPLGSFDMSNPLETLVREVIRTADKNTSRVEICTVCEYEHYPFFHFGSARKALMKWNTNSVVGFIVLALYNTSNTLLQQRKFQGHTANSWQEIFPRRQSNFPRQVTVWRYQVWGEPLTSLPLICKPASGTRASNGGRKISTKIVQKKRLPVVSSGGYQFWKKVWRHISFVLAKIGKNR